MLFMFSDYFSCKQQDRLKTVIGDYISMMTLLSHSLDIMSSILGLKIFSENIYFPRMKWYVSMSGLGQSSLFTASFICKLWITNYYTSVHAIMEIY